MEYKIIGHKAAQKHTLLHESWTYFYSFRLIMNTPRTARSRCMDRKTGIKMTLVSKAEAFWSYTENHSRQAKE